MPDYGLSIEQTGSGTLELSIGKDGSSASNLPSATVSVSFDGGKTFKAVQIKNGKAVLHVLNSDGNVIIRTSGPAVSVNLKDYVPYEEPQPEEPSTPTVPDASKNSSDSNKENGNGQGSEGTGDTTNVGNVGDIASSVASAVAAASASESSSSSEATANQQESAAASETFETSSESQSQSVVKSITVDEEFVKIAGIGAIILLIIIVIGAYYREDIENMLNTKK